MNLKVFLVEDDSEDCELFQEALKEIDPSIQIECRSDCVDFVEKLQDFKPNLVFLDLHLPKKHGFDCLQDIQLSELLKDLPVIVFTSNSSLKELPQKAIRYGAKIYFEKPSTFDMLVENLRYIFNLNWQTPETIQPLHIKDRSYNLLNIHQ